MLMLWRGQREGTEMAYLAGAGQGESEKTVLTSQQVSRCVLNQMPVFRRMLLHQRMNLLHRKSGLLSISLLSTEPRDRWVQAHSSPLRAVSMFELACGSPWHETCWFSKLDVLGVPLTGTGLKTWSTDCVIQALYSWEKLWVLSFLLTVACSVWGLWRGVVSTRYPSLCYLLECGPSLRCQMPRSYSDNF